MDQEQMRMLEVGNRVTVTPAGPLDLATASQLAQALAQARRPGVSEVVVDLADVTFLDSVGIAVLVRANREAAGSGVRLFLQGAQGSVAKVLEITGIGTALPPPPGEQPATR